MTPLESARAAYRNAIAAHHSEDDALAAAIAAHESARSQVETDLSLPVDEMALRRYHRGREIYGGDPRDVDWLAETYPELLDAYAMERYGRRCNGYLAKLIKDVAEWVRVELQERDA